ncbi:MAG: hypothetical protein WA964_07205 [Ilumatobacter sp.]|uniref:hypothetical protein n=1 Tax=Ilumatobacter sp. TaxID=1967498 RepID=UPI003C765253
MNVFDEIQGSRPEVAPMPLAKRRMIRETLFGIGHDDATRTITRRSESGAVVSTAPHGTRRPIQKRSRPAGSLAKLGAGLLVFAVLGAVVWSYSTRDDDTVESVESTTSTTSTTTTTSTVAPTTAPPLVRTGVSAGVPLALPPSLLPVDEVTVAPGAPGSSSVILGDPEGAEIWIAEFDGEAADPSGLDVRQIGGIGVGVERDREPDALGSYRPQVPCGLVILNDAPGQPLDRQPIVDLFSSMSIDGDATIDISLPTDWSVFSIGESRTTYSVQFQVPATGADAAAGATAPIRIAQVPNGSFAQLMFGGRQLDPIDFLGGPAFIDVGAADPALVSVFWKDSTTVFNASSSELGLADLESFVESLEPVDADAWNTRFGTSEPDAPAEPPACAPQPNFGPTLAP